MRITELKVGDLVIFKGDAASYPVTFIGPKYFHVDIGHGRESGPYTPDLLEDKVRQ